MKLSNDAAPQTTEEYFERFSRGRVLERLRTIGAKATPEELEALDADIDPLIRLGMEIDEQTNGIRRNLYGVFHLGWQAEANPGWPEQIASELEEIRQAIRTAHGAPLRYLIWAGMGGSIEDKRMYQAAGLLGEEVQFYALDSTDPAKLKGILADMERRSGATLGERLRSTLVVGMAMGMTSYEPVVNLEKLARIYDQEGIDARANFLYLTLPGSLLDQFAGPRGFRRVELQPDGRNSAAGRHTGPLTKGSLYPLGLAKADLRAWIEGTLLGQAEILTAWRLAAFLHAQGEAGRDKVTLLLPKPWAGAGLWTKQNFEESLGKSEELGIKIVIGETPKLEQYRAPKDARQDRVFLSVEFAGLRAGAARARLEKAGFPLAALEFTPQAPLSRYMQFMHYCVFGLAFLRDMNFVTQPAVELYKSIANKLDEEARRAGGITKTEAWRALTGSQRQARWRERITLYYGGIPAEGLPEKAPEIYAALLKKLIARREVEYGELTFFGDTSYSSGGRAVRKALEEAGEELFRSRLKMPVDVHEGPAMNHSYHEMVIGHGKGFSTILLSEDQEQIESCGYTADYHVAQFLATRRALAERRRPVVAILMKDLGAGSRAELGAFFAAATRRLGKG